MKVYIRNMVCNRCIAVVKAEIEKSHWHPLHITMGEVEFRGELTKEELTRFNKQLKLHGFELIDDKKGRLIEQIKNSVIEQIHYTAERPKMNFSDLLAKKLNKDYSTLSNLFSEVEGVTIEQYIILQKIEKVKELLIYDELSLSEIADKLNYSSVSYLSSQFKKVTGFTPSHFKTIKVNKRNSLDKVIHPG